MYKRDHDLIKISAKFHAKIQIWMSTIKERKWVSIQSLSKRGYILCWFNSKKRGLALVHYTFVSFIVLIGLWVFAQKFCRNVSKVMILLLHLTKLNFRMNGAGVTSLKLAHYFQKKNSLSCAHWSMTHRIFYQIGMRGAYRKALSTP